MMNRAGRLEDRRFVTGQGHYTADLFPRDGLIAVFVRSPVASGQLTGIDSLAAKAADGVHLVLTGADLAAAGLSEMVWTGEVVRQDGGPVSRSPRPILNHKELRHLGEPLVMIVADSQQQALDAAEMVHLDIEELPPVHAHDRGAPGRTVWPDLADNLASAHRLGDADKVQELLENSVVTASVDIDISRVLANTIEMRASSAHFDDTGRLVLSTATQSPFGLRNELAELLRLETDQLQVLTEDVGGSFGLKGGLFREDVLVCLAARQLGRPVSWTAGRTESFIADDQGRGVTGTARLGLDRAGRFTGLAVELSADIGAYLSRRTKGMLSNLGGIAGPYVFGGISAALDFVYSNSVPTSPYRGFGRPEATYIIEAVIDRLAAAAGVDPAELRRQNLVQPDQMPYQTQLTFLYDCGDFPTVMDKALQLADYAGFAARRATSEQAGKLRGIGISMPVENAGGPFKKVLKDVARLTLRPDGHLVVAPGAMSVGQGHETTFSRMAAERLGLKLDKIIYAQGDTDLLPSGRGNGGSASTVVAGSALALGLDQMLGEGRAIAAGILDCRTEDILFADGRFSAKGADRQLDWSDIAQHSNAGDGLSILSEFLPDQPTYPNGCHLCEIEIDPATGRVTVLDYAAIEDVGTVLNPQLVHGQMQGGIAQGIGQALGEVVIYDENGQMVNGSFMDYRMPLADDLPFFRLATHAVPTRINPLGAKGVGEAGTVGALAACLNAVNNALRSAGAAEVEMPASSEKVWQALQAAKK
jgi:carbon-monoxide dehydrogenase large subunit